MTKYLDKTGLQHYTDILKQKFSDLSGRGRYLSNWNCQTGLPTTNPDTLPYVYKSGDYFIVSAVDNTDPITNYRPSGTSYTGTASTTVETEVVKVNDTYLFDGTTWLLLNNTSREIVIDDELSTTSTNPVQNKVITEELNKKSGVIFRQIVEEDNE